MTKLKITLTKEILEQSKMCGLLPEHNGTGNGDRCAIAMAVHPVFPLAYVCTDEIHPYGVGGGTAIILLPTIARNFINCFDFKSPDERVKMSPVFFEIEIPDEIIEKINIDELRPLLTNHPTLELV
jgi:hypothetical protein